MHGSSPPATGAGAAQVVQCPQHSPALGHKVEGSGCKKRYEGYDMRCLSTCTLTAMNWTGYGRPVRYARAAVPC